MKFGIALEYARWGPMSLPEAVAADLAGQGVTRVIVPAASPGLDGQLGEMSAFAARLGLRHD